MITVLHLSDRATRDQRCDAMMGYDEEKHRVLCAELLRAGLYDCVAVVCTTDQDTAFHHTNHIDSAWNEPQLAASRGVVPASPTGMRSTSVGDIIADKDGFYVVASFGFKYIGDLMVNDQQEPTVFSTQG